MEVINVVAMSCLGFMTKLKQAYFRLSRPDREIGNSDEVWSSKFTILSFESGDYYASPPSKLLQSSGIYAKLETST